MLFPGLLSSLKWLRLVKADKHLKRGLAFLGEPITSKTVFRIASTSKQFTAACVVLLEEEGKLSLDDDVRKHIPELPEYKQTVTLRHMLHHISGLPEYLSLLRT